MLEPSTIPINFLFTDIEGSTRLWDRYPGAMQEALARHDALLSTLIDAHGGTIFKTVGDAFYAVFADAVDAVAAAQAAQQLLHTAAWNVGVTDGFPELRVRMALHRGPVSARGGDYFGATLNRAARLLAAGHGGQILLSQAVVADLHTRLPAGMTLRDLGEHRLRDLTQDERIFQLLAPDLPAEFPPLRTLNAHPTNLPAQRTPLVGRDQEVARLCTILRQAEVRVLTLTGPGGIGKTRIGLQAGADLIEEFEHGVWFVALAPVSDPALVLPTIASALGLSEEPGRTVPAILKDYLRPKTLLLVLDNFEQVLAAAPAVADLLDAAPGLKILVSSREELYIYGEYEFPVPPLALPDPQLLPPIAALAEVAAIALFVQRAQASQFDFALTAANAPIIAAICARLDGLPLSIELAAARSKHLTLAAMLAQLDQRLQALTGGPRDRTARQQSLRGTMDWSYNLLTAPERHLFAQLAVFIGGWAAEAAAALAPATPAGPAATRSVPGAALASLVAKNLIREEAGPDGVPRFGMLETIREYALEQLAAGGEAATIRRRHAAHYLALVEHAEPYLTGPEQGAWFARLAAEHDNLRAALGWTLVHATESALRLGCVLWRFWAAYSYLSEGCHWLEDALAGAPDAPATLRAKAWQGMGHLTLFQGDYPQARRFLEQSLALYHDLGDQSGRAWVLNSLGDIALLQNDPRQAETTISEALRWHRANGDRLGMARSADTLGQLAQDAGDTDRAVHLYEESLALRRELGSTEGIALSLSLLGDVRRTQGDYTQAAALYEEALTRYRDLQTLFGIAATLLNLGYTALRLGDPQRALGLFHEGLRLVRERGEKRILAAALAGLAGTLNALGYPAQAARLLGAVAALLATLGTHLDAADGLEYDRHLANTRTALDATAWTAAWTAGQAMSLEEATTYAAAMDVRAANASPL